MTGASTKIQIDPNKFDFDILSSKHVLHLDCTDDDGTDGQCLQYFLNKRALSYQNNSLGMTYVVSYDKKPIGYVTLSASSIHKDKIIQKKRPGTREGSHYPALIIVNFVIDKPLRRCGFGKYVLLYCSGLGRIIADKIGCRYIILFARDAIDFYLKNNFKVAELEGVKEFKMMYADLFPEKKK